MGFRDDVDGGPSGSAAEGGNPVQDAVSSPNDNVQFEDGPEAPPVTDGIPGETFVQYDKEDPPMTVGVIYGTMEELRMSLRTHAIKGQFVVVTEKCDRYRFRGYCKAKDDGCSWAIGARVTPDGKSVKVTVNKFEHKCTSTERIQTPMASKYWIAEKAINILKEHPNMETGELRKSLERKYNCILSYPNVYKGRQLAANQLFGSWEESFEMLYRFKAEVDLRNPGSVVEIDVRQVGEGIYFHRFFCCFKASIDGFTHGCRPYLSIDSTALNGRWNGHLAAATGLDGHNWMYPVAFAFFDAETTDNWTWFMKMVKKAIGEPEDLAISSDTCKGLENAVRLVYPSAEHRECFIHLMDNFIKKFEGPVYGNMYPAARSYLPSKFEHYMAKIYAANSKVKPWLDRYHNMLWMRSRFSEAIKCDYVTNNLAESWNAWVKELKDLPVTELADSIRAKTMQLYDRRRVGQRLQGNMLPALVHQLNAMTRHFPHLKVDPGGENSAEVTEVNEDLEVIRHVVNLASHTCTCREWQVSGKPCSHALAFLTTIQRFRMDDYMHPYFSVRNFQMAYAGIIQPLTDKSQWLEVNLAYKVQPPLAKKSAGRQRKNRIVGCLEKSKPKSKGMCQVKCKGCGELGHRQSSSKCHLNGTKKRKSRAKGRPQEGCASSLKRQKVVANRHLYK